VCLLRPAEVITEIQYRSVICFGALSRCGVWLIIRRVELSFADKDLSRNYTTDCHLFIAYPGSSHHLMSFSSKAGLCNVRRPLQSLNNSNRRALSDLYEVKMLKETSRPTGPVEDQKVRTDALTIPQSAFDKLPDEIIEQ
jgi:hypothetical protein